MSPLSTDQLRKDREIASREYHHLKNFYDSLTEDGYLMSEEFKAWVENDIEKARDYLNNTHCDLGIRLSQEMDSRIEKGSPKPRTTRSRY